MGDRISIQFKKGNDLSAVLFSHWDGMELKKQAENYIQQMVTEKITEFAENNQISGMMPLDRLEPETVMVSFVSEIIGQGKRIPSNYYMPDDIDHGDNSDNGHFIIDIDIIGKLLWNVYSIRVKEKEKTFAKEIEN